jgi:hypothetical protein
MRTCIRTLLVLLAVFSGVAAAQQDISGTWAGTLQVAPGQALNIHFVLTKAGDGTYSAIVTSPDTGGIKDVKASSVRFESDRLTLDVAALSGSYDGTWQDGGFTGEWRQQGTALPLRLTRYEKPVLSDAARKTLAGSWVGKLEAAAGLSYTFVYRFETNDAGEFVGYLDSIDEGARGIPMTDVELADGKLTLKIPRARAEFTATLNGDALEGTWKQSSVTLPLTMRRGEYVPPQPALSAAARKQLAGSWVGTVDPPTTDAVTLVARFETNADGRFVAFLDSPDQGRRGLPVTDIVLADGRLSLRVPAAAAVVSGAFDGERLNGTFKQGASELPLVLTRGTYTPARRPLELSDAALRWLEGRWRGRLGPTEILVRFETTGEAAGGDVAAGYFTVPAQGLGDVAVTSVSLAGDQLTLRIGALGMEYKAELSTDEAKGQWQLGPGNVLPVTLMREREAKSTGVRP